ncbi:hypothetical protein [Streptomyces sp. RerS4]|uniref:hypothetical protein n=1 Tax=Streptomyces sp. RerS4 TaxID=2942449 RepID=UPI0032E3661B
MNTAATEAGSGIDAGMGARAGAAGAVDAAAAPPASGHCTGIVQVPVAVGSALPVPNGTIIGGGA